MNRQLNDRSSRCRFARQRHRRRFRRLAACAGHFGADAGLAAAQAERLLAGAVTTQASVLAHADGFAVAALGALLCLVLVAAMRKGAPSPF